MDSKPSIGDVPICQIKIGTYDDVIWRGHRLFPKQAKERGWQPRQQILQVSSRYHIWCASSQYQLVVKIYQLPLEVLKVDKSVLGYESWVVALYLYSVQYKWVFLVYDYMFRYLALQVSNRPHNFDEWPDVLLGVVSCRNHWLGSILLSQFADAHSAEIGRSSAVSRRWQTSFVLDAKLDCIRSLLDLGNLGGV